MKLKTLFTATTILPLLLGCGSNQSDQDRPSEVDIQSTTLDGSWMRGCHKSQYGWEMSSAIFSTSGTTIFNRFVYRDQSCTLNNYKITGFGTYAVNTNPVPIPQGAISLEITFSTLEITAQSDQTVQEMNKESFCGYSDWNQGTAISVLGKTCGTLARGNPFTEFNIHKIVGKKLFLGRLDANADGSSIEKRPEALDDEPFEK